MPDEILLVNYVLEESSSEEHYSLPGAAQLAARGSVAFLEKYAPPRQASKEVQLWLSSGARKHLRRAKKKDFDKLLELPGLVLSGPRGRLFISPVTTRENTPKAISRLQLSGFKWAEDEQAPTTSPVEIVLNEELSMSFGKSLVAAAHASQDAFLYFRALAEKQEFESWRSDDFATTVKVAPLPEVSLSLLRVIDHGHTEVAPGSPTAAVVLQKELA